VAADGSEANGEAANNADATAATPDASTTAAANGAAADATTASTAQPVDGAAGDSSGEAVVAGVGPGGEGFVIEIFGHHYHNDADAGTNIRANFVRNTLIKNILTKKIKLPVVNANGETVTEEFTMNELGVDFPVIVYNGTLEQEEIGEGGAKVSDGYSKGAGKTTTLQKSRFIVQMSWKPTPATERLNNRKQHQAQPKEDTALAGVTNPEQGNTP
jgi:hypothetical protein